LHEEAVDFLKMLQGPLGIISVAGMYRTGKSYLLNRMLLNRSGGFGVGPTINPCTKVPYIFFFHLYYVYLIWSFNREYGSGESQSQGSLQKESLSM